MPWTVIPKFHAAAAALTNKVDAVLRELASLLNGGLDSRNMKPGTLFPLASFQEQGALVGYRAALHNSNAYDLNFGNAPPVACSIVGVGVSGSLGEATPGKRVVDLYVNGFLRKHIETTTGRYSEVLAVPIAVDAGAIVSAQTSAAGEVPQELEVFLTLRIPHVA